MSFKKSLSFIEKFTLFLTKVVIFALGNLIENIHEFIKNIESREEVMDLLPFGGRGGRERRATSYWYF